MPSYRRGPRPNAKWVEMCGRRDTMSATKGFGGEATGGMDLPCRNDSPLTRRAGRGKRASAEFVVGLTDQTLSCAAGALVATAGRGPAGQRLSSPQRVGRAPLA